ncbi:MAG: glycosyltransferase family 2 protein [Bacteroidales bacterium]|nr:glycosyltransferase family 2 protein [Bacteroidales bacterium]
MNKLAVCIPTFKRPAMLEHLLNKLIQCNIDESRIESVTVIIVDNDADGSAAEVANRFTGTSLKRPFDVRYFTYPVKGLSNVRNELVKRSMDEGADYMLFIDDDEYPHPDWIIELLQALETNDADMARGPVIPVFEEGIPDSIRYWFKRKDYRNNQKIKAVATNNLILKVESLKKLKIRFDERFNFTGSEDAYFGMQMYDKGASLYWTNRAMVYEFVPYDRTNLSWLMKRKHRGATNFIYKMRIEKKYGKMMYKFMVSVFYILSGTAGLVLFPLPVKPRYWGLLTISEGMGGLAGLMNYRPEGY